MKAPLSSLLPKRTKQKSGLQNILNPQTNNVYENFIGDVKGVQRVWFAGEHTSKQYFGYAHGAWERYQIVYVKKLI